MKPQYIIALAASALAGVLIASCSSNTPGLTPATGSPGSPSVSPPRATFNRSSCSRGRPSRRRSKLSKPRQNQSLRTYQDPTLRTQIKSFALNFRNEQTAATLQAVLYPTRCSSISRKNVTTASYLGYETGGATGSKFGGRALSDDIIDIRSGRSSETRSRRSA